MAMSKGHDEWSSNKALVLTEHSSEINFGSIGAWGGVTLAKPFREGGD